MRLLLDWGAAVDKVWRTSLLITANWPKNLYQHFCKTQQVWGASPSGGNFHAGSADSPPSSHWAFKTSTPSVHSADSEDAFADLLDVKEETSGSPGVAVRRKRRKSKSPKFTVGISVL